MNRGVFQKYIEELLYMALAWEWQFESLRSSFDIQVEIIKVFLLSIDKQTYNDDVFLFLYQKPFLHVLYPKDK